jgi:hypothetical protein
MIAGLRQELAGATIFYSNVYDISMDIIQNASSYGMWPLCVFTTKKKKKKKKQKGAINVISWNFKL